MFFFNTQNIGLDQHAERGEGEVWIGMKETVSRADRKHLHRQGIFFLRIKQISVVSAIASNFGERSLQCALITL